MKVKASLASVCFWGGFFWVSFCPATKATELRDMHFVDVSNDLIKKNIYEKNIFANSSTDHTEAVQAAINFVSKNGGGAVYLPEGQYNFRSVEVVKNVSLIGAGADKTVVRALDASWGLIVMRGGELKNMTLYGTRQEGSGDNWKVGSGGIGKGGTAMPICTIAVDAKNNSVTIDNVNAYEARYDPLYVRDVNGLRVLNCEFDRAGRNVVSLVGNTVDFIFSKCYFGSYWGLYHFDIEQNHGNYINNGVFVNCTFDGTKAGEMGTDTWGAFFGFSGEEDLRNYNVSVFGSEFRNIYIRVQGVFRDVCFVDNVFNNSGAVFVRIRSNPIGEFRNIEVRNNRFYRDGGPNMHIISNAAITGDSRFINNFPDSTNNINLAKESSDHRWEEVHPVANIDKLERGQTKIENEDEFTIVHMPLSGYSIRFSDNKILDYEELKKIQCDPNATGLTDLAFHYDPLIALGHAGIQLLGKGSIKNFVNIPKEGYLTKLFGAEAGCVYAVRTQEKRYLWIEIIYLDKQEIKFKYKYSK